MADEKELNIQKTEKQEVAQSGAERTRARLAFVPRADIYETNEAIVLVTDMPGVDEKSLDITLEDDVLTINGYVEASYPEGYGLSYGEYRVGDYQRSFTLSNKIDRNKIEATVKDGVLRLYLPKAEPATRKIAIAAG
ncbi:MAG TPA: Hsp20/alpha crystallin family protein [Anaerolineae bacterium]|nr:Hsp20/alpha crystallin family protein [Anaerolineae bacterium]HQH37324.1 Hsp20/alpha crystallin family protein [Anaerolineae bacterium]